MLRSMLAASFCLLMSTRVVAQDPAEIDPRHYHVEFEDEQVRVLRLTLGPLEQAAASSHPDQVVVYFTADLAGRITPVEAVWQPAGTHEPQNSATTIFEAILVELRAPRSPVPAPLAPELIPAQPTPGIAVRQLVDNGRVTVSKHRLAPVVRGEVRHFHPRDTIVVYLSGGQMIGTTGRRNPSGGGRPVRRGQADVLPANTLHAFVNMGNDPIDFIMVQPK